MSEREELREKIAAIVGDAIDYDRELETDRQVADRILALLPRPYRSKKGCQSMTERLSDERLRELLESQMQWHSKEFVVAPMARELLELRAEAIALTGALKMAAAERDNFAAALSAGPVMPEVPSNTVIYAIEVEKARGAGGAINFYNAIRTALLKEQSR